MDIPELFAHQSPQALAYLKVTTVLWVKDIYRRPKQLQLTLSHLFECISVSLSPHLQVCSAAAAAAAAAASCCYVCGPAVTSGFAYCVKLQTEREPGLRAEISTRLIFTLCFQPETLFAFSRLFLRCEGCRNVVNTFINPAAATMCWLWLLHCRAALHI